MGKCTFPSKSSPAEKNLAGPDGEPVASRNHHSTSLQTLEWAGKIGKSALQRNLHLHKISGSSVHYFTVRMFHLTVECAEIRVLFSSRVMARQRDMTRASHVGVCGPVLE